MKTGSINGQPYSIPDDCEIVRTSDLRRLQGFATLVSDLDRNFEGRHEGDASSGDVDGVSQGNPSLQVGAHIGHTMSGDKIIVPTRQDRHDPKAWVQPR